MKKIIEVGSDEDGEVYYVVGDCTRRGAWIAIRRFLIEDCGLDPDFDDFPKMEELEQCNFRHTTEDESGYYEDWYWWGKPVAGIKTEPAGKGWIYKT